MKMGKTKGRQQATRQSVVGSSNDKVKRKRGSKIAAEKLQADGENENSTRDGGRTGSEEPPSTAVAHIGKDTSSDGNGGCNYDCSMYKDMEKMHVSLRVST